MSTIRLVVSKISITFFFVILALSIGSGILHAAGKPGVKPKPAMGVTEQTGNKVKAVKNTRAKPAKKAPNPPKIRSPKLGEPDLIEPIAVESKN